MVGSFTRHCAQGTKLTSFTISDGTVGLAWTHISDPTALAAAFVDMIKDGSLPKALWASLEVLGLGFVSGAPD
jgi:ABC-type nitrate/sulfonate/bicarbonate transport system permease component